ncbi:hypothetical protein [[Eubacterium] cellulosolvens]
MSKLLNKPAGHNRRAMNVSKNKKTKILFTLDKTQSAAPLEYISVHSGIRDPCALLQQLEKNGLVISTQLSNWSASLSPQFELTDRAREFCKKYPENKL